MQVESASRCTYIRAYVRACVNACVRARVHASRMHGWKEYTYVLYHLCGMRYFGSTRNGVNLSRGGKVEVVFTRGEGFQNLSELLPEIISERKR